MFSLSIGAILIAFVVLSVLFSIIGFLFKIAWNVFKFVLILGLSLLLAPFVVMIL